MSLAQVSQPHPRPDLVELVTHVPTLLRAPHEYLSRLQARHGGLIHLATLPGGPVFLVSDPACVKHVLLSNHRNYAKAGLFRQLYELGFGKGLINAEGSRWQHQRRMIQPHFQAGPVARFTHSIVATTRERIALWKRSRRVGETFDLEAEMLDLTAQIISRAVLGLETTPGLHSAREAFLKATRVALLPDFLVGRTLNRVKRARSKLEHTVKDVLAGEAQLKRDSDSLAYNLLNSHDPRTGQAMSPEVLVDELITLLFTGYETTALALTWILLLLLRNRPALWHLQRELEATIDTPEQIDRTHLSRLNYMDSVIHEAMRLYPPAWATGRQALNDDRIAGYLIPGGSRMILSQYLTHRNPQVWLAPHEFRPARFRSGVREWEAKYAYFPFGGGPRICVGQHFAMLEIKAILAVLLTGVSLSLAGKDPAIGRASVTMRPARPILVRLQ